MSITVDDSTVARWTGTPSGVAAITSATFTPANNSLLVLCINGDEFDDSANKALAVAGGSLTWTERIRRGATEAGAGIAAIWTAPVSTGASMAIDVNRTTAGGEGSGRLSAKVYIVTGQHASPIGNSNSANWTTDPQSLSVTAAGAGRLFGCGTDWNANGSPTSSDTEDAAHYASQISVMSAYKSADHSSGSQSIDFNPAGTPTGNVVVLEILAAAGGGGTVNTQTLTDTLSVSDAGLDYVFFNRLMESLLSVTDGAIRSQIFGAHFTDTLTIDEQSATFMVRGRVAESFIDVTDEALAVIVGNNILTKVLSSNIDITDSSVLSIIRGRLLQDTIDVTEPGAETFTTTNLVVTDEVTADDSIVTRLLLTRLLGDSIDISDSAIASIIGQNVISKILSSTILTADEAQLWLSRSRLGESTVLTSDQIQSVFRYTRLLEDAIDAADESQSALKRFIMLTDALAIDDSLFSLILTPTTDNPIIRIGFDQPRIEIGGYLV